MKLIDILEGDNPNSAYGWTGVLATPVQPASTRPDKGKAADDSMQRKLGTYVAVTPTSRTKQKLIFFCEDNGIANHVEFDDMHATLIKSKTYLDGFQAAGHFEYPLIGSNLRVVELKKGVLAVAFDSPSLQARYNRITADFASTYTPLKPSEGFLPHITICYELDVDVDCDLLTYNLTKYLDVVELSSEYEEPLDVLK